MDINVVDLYKVFQLARPEGAAEGSFASGG